MLGGETAQHAHHPRDSNHGEDQRCARLGSQQVETQQDWSQVPLHLLDSE
jgi:hypothetical protein